MIHGLVDAHMERYLRPHNENRSCGSNEKYGPARTSKGVCSLRFYQRTVREWSSLQPEIVECTTQLLILIFRCFKVLESSNISQIFLLAFVRLQPMYFLFLGKLTKLTNFFYQLYKNKVLIYM